MDVRNKHVLVVGLARSGQAVAHVLARRGAVVTVTDRKPPAEFSDALPKLLKDKVGLELGLQRQGTFLHHQAIVISPGVPWDLPELEAARRRRIPVYPEVEVATWFLKGTLVGVTGSNGKTTTTALLGHMLEASGFPTFVGGNIGNALSSAVGHARPGTKFVAELSSFQLEGIHDLRPHVAVMLNLSPNHLDRHANLQAYAQAKRQIFRNQREEDYAVLNADDPWVAGLQAEVHSRPVFFSRRHELPSGVFVSGGKIYYRVHHLERVLFETRDVSLRGDFNLEDVLAATTAACVLGADFAAIRKAVREFKAVEHRLEFVGEIQGVDFYNNSKATSVDATVKSLEAFEHGVHLIMGGKDKGAPYTPLLPVIKGRVREILLIGAAAPIITAHLSGSTELVQAGDLSTAVYEALARARPGDTVLLAPACASFDQFKDFEERGCVFKELVKKLASEVSQGKVVRKAPPTAPETKAPIDRLPEAAPSELKTTLKRAEPLATGLPAVESPAEKPRPPEAAALPEPPGPAVPTEIAPPLAPPGEPGAKNAPDHPKRLNYPEIDLDIAELFTKPEVVSEAEPEQKRSEHAGPKHLELTYVYEVDAVEMPMMESQVVPEDVPSISISPSMAEALDEDALPFEVRKKESPVPSLESEVRGPESGVERQPRDQETKFEAPLVPRQPRLPGVE